LTRVTRSVRKFNMKGGKEVHLCAKGEQWELEKEKRKGGNLLPSGDWKSGRKE